MLEILTTVLTSSISKLFDASIDIASKDISWKRSTSTKFIDLFSSLLELEKSSKEIVYEVKGIIEGTEVLSKVVFRKKLERFFKNYESFIRELRRTQSILSIYDNDLLIKLEGLRERKHFNTKLLDLMLEISPRPVTEDDHATTLIIYPTKLPPKNLVPNKNFPRATQDDLEQEVKKIKRQIVDKLEFKTIDIAVAKEGRLLLENIDKDIHQIEKLRIELSDFIKKNFPLDEILK